MTQNIAVVGAGIAGMCTALALARKNLNVILFERDTPPPQGDPDQAFYDEARHSFAIPMHS